MNLQTASKLPGVPEIDDQSILARAQLEKSSTLHWLHWLIISLSLLLTFFAWHYSKSQQQRRIESQFDREVEQVIELVLERMKKYEDALWSGVALIRSSNEDVDYRQWKTYADSLDLEEKYPGINGIGVIHALEVAGVDDYLARQREQRPDFAIHPPHDEQVRYPISYIIPVEGNEQAVGLDMAHEANRFTAAQKARDTGAAQITGPIKLVQDSGKTPGFLFYAPFYSNEKPTNGADRKQSFQGMVYAPFVVKKLMRGTLEKERRHVGLRLIDAGEVIYDEHVAIETDFDPDPIFKRSIEVPLNGRTWTFDIWSANSFRKAANDSQPLTILLGGLLIDSLLIALFVSISRASHRALGYADSMTARLRAKTGELEVSEAALADRAKQLENSNAELEQFAYVASHDLQEPLRKISSYGQLLRDECGQTISEEGHEYLNVVIGGANRLKQLVMDLLAFSRISTRGKPLAPTNAEESLRSAIEQLELTIKETGAEIRFERLPTVMADDVQLAQVFQNLIGNAIKYRGQETPEVAIDARDVGDEIEFSVRDNGIGIDEKYFERVFEIFQRLHNRREYSGTGIGLAVCKRIIERFGGKIWLDSVPGEGSTFFFTVDKAYAEGDADAQHRELEPVSAAH